MSKRLLAMVVGVTLGILPWAVFPGLAGLLMVLLVGVAWQWQAVVAALYRQGWLGLGGLLLLSSALAVHRQEAWLQLVHFLPFFVLWGVIVQVITMTPRPWLWLERWALAMTWGSIPVTTIALGEFLVKRYTSFRDLSAYPLLDWLYIGEISGHRIYAVFDNPNILANYLVIALGITLGMLWQTLDHCHRRLPQPAYRLPLVLTSLMLILAALVYAGSRNSYWVAMVQLLLVVIAARRQRWLLLMGGLGLVAIASSAVLFGIGGRQLSWELLVDPIRLDLWRLALEMITQAPLWGVGLGNYKLLYVPGSIAGYSSFGHPHNLWLMLAAEVGIPATVLFTGIVGRMCYGSLASWINQAYPAQHRALITGYGLAFLGTTLFSGADVTLFDPRINALGWVSLAVLYAIPRLGHLLSSNLSKLT
ncbi:O-antigen ligase family protein [Halomicronema hongdechloris]|uniref:O-antigen ligase family protein n=1 Tax=Halomicronema hongdechloris TaxID=1209493 RepID=UPI001650E076|nr:O-antigen ligase family protein [Halomicronema hongdechloris]